MAARSNTPVASSFETNTMNNNRRTTVLEVEAAIESDIRNYAGITTDLIHKHFGSSPKVVEAAASIYKTLVKESWYIPGHRGRPSQRKNLPLNPKSEKELYRPLTAVLSAISSRCNRDRTFDITWQDWHSKSPDSQFMADMKPDILAVVKTGGTWWRALQTVIEVKKKADMFPAILQLLRYVRQALREQPDRRFMHGLVFSMYNLTVWHVDRSGALASEVFNIHEEPLKFIKVIVGFLMLKPEDLGWDPTMKMYVEEVDGNKITRRYGVPSYTVKENEETGKSNAYERMWTISVPKPGAEPAESSSDNSDAPPLPPPEEEEFVVFRALSLSRAEVLKGRATRIWKAWRMADMEQPKQERKVYVIKDCWRDERRGLEGALYLKAGACPGVALLYSHGKVRIGKRKEVDCTFKLVRKNVTPQGESLDLRTQQSSAPIPGHQQEDMRVMPSVTTSRHGSTTSIAWSRDYFASITGHHVPRIPRNRIHTRLVMASHGYSISKFVTLQELIGAVHDALKGHKWLCEKGILHRDISMGNILITGLEAPGARGILIDLDNAIVYEGHQTLIDDERTGTMAFMSYEILMNMEYFAGSLDAPPTGSKETIRYNIRRKTRTEMKGVAHDYVHDLESFFWVLCWLCVAREGPGRARHFSADGLNEKQKAQAMQIQNAIVVTFEQKSMTGIANQKKSILANSGTFQDVIINSFTPYFEPLEELLRWLHGDLRRAYTDRKFEGLHDKFLDYLYAAEQALCSENWEATDKSYMEMSKAVEEQRKGAKAVWDSPKPERIAQPNRATSSSSARTGSKRRRTDEELEAIAEQPEDESSSAPSEKRNTKSAARKRQRTAGPSRDQQSEDAESTAADGARFSSPLRGKAKAAKKVKTTTTTGKVKAIAAKAKAKAAEMIAKAPARRSARLAESKGGSSRSGRH